MELLDIYDKDRRFTGKVCLRGEPRQPGEYMMAVCVWVYDGAGKLLLTRRAPEKSFAGTWENSGGAAQSGEDSRTAISRELREETGLLARPEEFEFLCTTWDSGSFFDHYCLQRRVDLSQIRLQPGETDDVMWADFDTVHQMIRDGKICSIIAEQFLRMEQELRKRQTAQ